MTEKTRWSWWCDEGNMTEMMVKHGSYGGEGAEGDGDIYIPLYLYIRLCICIYIYMYFCIFVLHI